MARMTVTLDDDVAALIRREHGHTGESFRQVVNRLLRLAVESARQTPPGVELPLLSGRPRVDITDTSAVVTAEDDEHRRRSGARQPAQLP